MPLREISGIGYPPCLQWEIIGADNCFYNNFAVALSEELLDVAGG